MLIRYNTEHAVLDTFKLLVQAVCDGSTEFNINAGIGNKEIHISCICNNPKHVGILLGKSYNRNGIQYNTPTKQAIIRILQVIAKRTGYDNVTVNFEDNTKQSLEVK